MRLKSALMFPLLAAGLLVGCGNAEAPKTSAEAKPAPAEAVPSASYLDKIKARDKLIVGVFSDKPPFGYVDEAGNYVGFDTDIAKRFAQDLLGDEKKVEFVVVEPASRIPFLQSDKVDLILANMTVTPERAQAVDFTNPNLRVAVQAIVREDSGIQTLDDLADKTLIVTTGTTADIWLTQNRPDWKLLKFEKNSESLQALANGRGDAYAQDNLVLFSWAKQNPGYRVLADKLGDEAPIAPAVKKGNSELRDWVNAELAKLGEEQFLLKLYDQYVRKDLADDTDPGAVIVEGGNWQG
ncbi:MAG TPA: transporter substrate-binding domain-containing protein [Pseudomonas sp.]|uniref:transporter substrate-binding domain-containing protein n=1 Tax=Stutzerimonas nitrititolerans TaxID=2482751 RepID=UPI0014834C6C|nr:transporter substrate-binding domain-containing protein [Stutzerimonas nitrititolerans]NNT95353.1 transporter substrate-binding domain-containing protein [Stutzerimonas nitrititolerans]HLT04907.1 transporter substrate-binding domain-containing protein [Pseudomonas sp.]